MAFERIQTNEPRKRGRRAGVPADVAVVAIPLGVGKNKALTTRFYVRDDFITKWLGNVDSPVGLKLFVGSDDDSGKLMFTRAKAGELADISIRKHSKSEWAIQSVNLPRPSEAVHSRQSCEIELVNGGLIVRLPWSVDEEFGLSI